MHFRVFWTVQKENQIKYGLIKVVNFTIMFFKRWLKDNDIEMYSTHNEAKSVVAVRFITNCVKKFITNLFI